MELDAILYTKIMRRRGRNGLKKDWGIIDRSFMVGERGKGVA